jgi:type IV pilus assembly protein PilY1
MKRLIFLVMFGFAVLALGPSVPESMATSPTTMVDYTAYPPFVGNAMPPNVLLLMDNSGSMQDSAYHPGSESYVSTKVYGGYFDNTKCYSYGSSKFSVEAGTVGSCPNWDGNFLNFITMEKMEIAKFVMMGGKCSARNASGNCLGTGNLIGETTEGVNSVNYTASAVSPFTGTCTWDRKTNSGVSQIVVGKFNSSSGTACGSGGSYTYTKSFNLTVVPTTEPTGIIQQVGGKARFGLMEYNSTDGGHVIADVGATPLVNNSACGTSGLPIVNAIECTNSSTWTPLAESLYEASRYYAQIPPAFSSSDYSYTTQSRDPYYFNSPNWMIPAGYVPCCKSFVIMFTDGQPTQDLGIPATVQDYAHTAAQHTAAHHNVCSAYYGGASSDPCTSNGSHYLDDVAYWAHKTDLRPDTGNIGVINATPPATTQRLAGMQNITLYTFFAFGTGSNLLKDAAMVGAFDDLNGDGKPFKDATCGTSSANSLCKEWDKDGDGIPDTYFESSDAFMLRDRLMAAITDILRRSASGTSVSILSTTEKGEGALYQAYFYPSKFEGLNQIGWLGYLQGLFLDSMGNLREDSNQNQTLDLTTDKIIKLVFDTVSGKTMVQRFDDSNGDGTPDSTTPSDVVPLDDTTNPIKPIWEAGKSLALRADTDRHIYTWVDSNNDGKVTSSEFISFDSSKATLLRPFLQAATSTESQNIINFIRGAEVSGYRDRCVTVAGASAQTGCTGTQRVWKLGDIIYSTPVTVGKPKEQYDLVYKDGSYQQFIQKYQNRRNVVYVGANDGMLHAFNAGTYDSNTRKFDPGTGHTLGEELWGFVPYNLLPHLKWLAQTNYTHVYYVDLKPKVVDAKIFTADADHPGGWGTVLIGGMRFGGGGVDVTDDFGSGSTTKTFKSSYFALDITNPDNPPALLWAATHINLGFTTSYPAVARVADSTGSSTWVVVMGSGPTTYTGDRVSSTLFSGTDNEGHLYVHDLATGAPLKRIDTGNTSNEFMGDVITLDGNLDYGVDTVYVGSAYKNGTAWNGNLYRVVTKNDTDPNNWAISTVYAATGPILEAPSASIDSFSHIWLYFGTGRFLSGSSPTNDKADTSQQAMYGIKETKMCWLGGTPGCPGSAVTYSQLLNVSSVEVKSDGSLITGASNDAATTFSQLVGDSRSSFQGWVLNFPAAGERVLAKPIIIGGIVLFSTFTPTSDICGYQGEGRLYAVYFETGSAYDKSVIGSDTSTGKITRDSSLGQGVPSMAGLHVGAEEGVRGFVQQGTGSISEVDGEPPFKFKSGIMTWQEKQM